MKTVMKKMFCLMLVAVLMVGVMPFQAFADKYSVTINVVVGDTGMGSFNADTADDGTVNLDSLRSQADALAGTNVAFVGWQGNSGSTYTGTVTVDGPWSFTALYKALCATCGQDSHSGLCAGQCGTCMKLNGHELTCADTYFVECCGAAKSSGHDAGCANNPANITYTLTLQLRLGETSKDIVASKSKSGLKGDINLKAISEELFPTYTYLWTQLGKGVDTMTIDQDTTLIVRMSAPVVTNTCSICGETYVNGTTHTCPTCNVVSGCVLTKNHSGEHECACGLYPQKSSSHNASCPFYEAVVINNPNNTYSLKVWAKLWVGETLTKTILLDTFTGLNGTEVVPYVIGNNVSRLESKFPSGYTNTEWTKAVYYYIDSNTTGTVDTNMNVNEEDNVYINLYSQEKLVVARVHTAKIYGIDRSVQVGGFRVGETVTYDDVLKAVSKYYNVSSMKMYTYGDWEKVVAGGNPSTTPYFTVHEGDNVFEVYITGTYKSTGTSTTYKADSTNPKTGDAIFAPIMVLGLSASALAVLYYLNKKRAF